MTLFTIVMFSYACGLTTAFGIAWYLQEKYKPQKARPDFIAGYDAGMADAKRIDAMQKKEQKHD